MGKELLAVKDNLVHTLHRAGMRLRTRVIVEAFRHYFLPDKTFSKQSASFIEKVQTDPPQDGGGVSTIHGSTFEHQGEGKLPLYVSGRNKRENDGKDKMENNEMENNETNETDNKEQA